MNQFGDQMKYSVFKSPGIPEMRKILNHILGFLRIN